jgi:hypothetical protein
MKWQALIWIVSMASMFAFLSVFWWALQRRRERESQLRYDHVRRLLERDGPEERRAALAWLEEQESAELIRRRQGLALTSLVLVAIGLGAFIALQQLHGDDTIPAWWSLLIGLALQLHLLLTRRPAGRLAAGSPGSSPPH